MAYENFIPSVWSEAINRGLERACVFLQDCNRQYEGDVSEMGDSVHILGVGKPSIKTLNRENASGEIDAAEEVADSSVILNVNQIRYFNYKEGIANAMDKFVADLAKEATPLYDTAKTVTKDNVLDIIDDAIERLQEQDVNISNGVSITISPKFYKLFKKAYISADTDNSEFMKKGMVTRYGSVLIRMSNNVAKESDGSESIMIRTKRAIAFVNPLTHTEAYRPENSFADAVKGFVLFDGKIVRPEEIIKINVKYA